MCEVHLVLEHSMQWTIVCRSKHIVMFTCRFKCLPDTLGIMNDNSWGECMRLSGSEQLQAQAHASSAPGAGTGYMSVNCP